MSTQHTELLGQQSQSTALQRTATDVTLPSYNGDSQPQGAGQDDHILVHFNGHFNGQFNGAFLLPSNMYQKPAAENDAQIAARRAMARRNSRSFAARISRTRSRKLEVVGRSAKPGITVDTSFTSHKGNVPHQVYPRENEHRSSASIKKQGWLGLGRSGTKTKGLGITKGTPQPERHATGPTPRIPLQSRQPIPNGTPEFSRPEASNIKEPKTAGSATSSNKGWQEISPWDRPIPIGISVPSDSVPDFSPYQTTRMRSESDATLATPSIIITPAAAMKSIWSPDTDSDYTPARSSSIYSRATFNMASANPDVPPVPALPADVRNMAYGNKPFPSHTRSGTLDSAGTAFEEEDDDDDYEKRNDRIMSTGTVFEEDDTPLRDRNAYSTLTVDTTVPTPRRSQGWWNVITTPFMMSRRNSVWTQNGYSPQKTPDVPAMPAEFGGHKRSPSSPFSMMWSATERTSTTRGDSPSLQPSLSTAVTSPEINERNQHTQATPKPEKMAPSTHFQFQTNYSKYVIDEAGPAERKATSPPPPPLPLPQQTTRSPNQHDVSSASVKSASVKSASVKSASPPVGTAAIGTVFMPRQVENLPQPININIELQDRRPEANSNATSTSIPMLQPVYIVSAPPQPSNIGLSSLPNNASQQSAPVFPPPPQPSNVGLSLLPNDSSQQSAPVFPPPPQPSNVGLTLLPNNAAQQSAPAFPPPPQPSNVGLTLPQSNASQQSAPAFPPPPQSSNVGLTLLPNNAAQQSAPVFPPPPQPSNVGLTLLPNNAAQQSAPVFPPPPTITQKSSNFGYEIESRASTPVSSMGPSEKKPQKQHRKIDKLLSQFALCRRKKGANDADAQGKKKKKRSKCFWCCGCCLVFLVLLAILIPLVVVFTKKNTGGTKVDDPRQETPSQWLNLTGYPPIPTGISTITQPENVEEENGCVAPATLWSCSLPKEQHKSVSPNKADQPNFKLDIVFENGSVADATKTRPVKRAANAVSAGAFIRSQLLKVRAVPSASPDPPSLEDVKFLSQTTEKNTAPFEGEETPFFISFKDPLAAASSRLAKRADSEDPTNITLVIPPPELDSDGTAAPARLLPFPSGQRLRLYNRGKPDEHYGFYTYFDRSIFLKDITSTTGRGGNPADTDGGSLRDAASLRCTFSQTRFLVQIWTRSQATRPLLQSSDRNSSDTTSARPGSFPYPVTITLDRHGGDFAKKNLFCYRMENDTTIIDKTANKFFQFEDRAFGGNLVNGTQGKTNVKGPIDGGSGGCSCQWQNWLN